MPTFDANTLPSSTGFDLGSAAQRWDAFLQTLDVTSTTTLAGATIISGALSISLLSTLNGIRFVDGTTFATIQAAIDDLP